MKYRFDELEAIWLTKTLHKLVAVTARSGNEAERRIVKKMQYKFGPGATLVNLGEKERSMLQEVAAFRAQTLETNPTEELTIVRKILGVLRND